MWDLKIENVKHFTRERSGHRINNFPGQYKCHIIESSENESHCSGGIYDVFRADILRVALIGSQPYLHMSRDLKLGVLFLINIRGDPPPESMVLCDQLSPSSVKRFG